MPEIGPFVAPLAFAYGAACSGALAALLIRVWRQRDGRCPTLFEAALCVCLPILAVVLISAVAGLQPHSIPALGSVHDWWHRWEDAVHAAPAAHQALHAANWAVLAIAAWLTGQVVFAGSRMWTFECSLRRSARATEQAGVFTIDSPRPLCLTVGLLRPAIYVSTGFLERLSASDLEVVLAHEAAHVRRRDTLCSGLLTLFYVLLPVPGGRQLLGDWRIAVERTCDREAARRVGDPLDVAGTLIRVARLVAWAPAPLPNSACFAGWGEDVEGRVTSLLQNSAERTNGWAVGMLTGSSASILLSAALWLPHAVDLLVCH